jgi:hypothetical protein
MEDDLLESARRQAEKAASSIRAAALLRIARAESAGDVAQARRTLLAGLAAVQELPSPVREHLLEEGRCVAAAVSPELLNEMPRARHAGRDRFASFQIVRTMIDHGHVDAAFNYLLQYDHPASFPFFSVGAVLHRLERNRPQSDDRRLTLLRYAVEMWRQTPAEPHPHDRHEFLMMFGHFWAEFPAEEAHEVARTVVERALADPDTGTSSSYSHDVHFTSSRQNTLFEILHVLRHLDPVLARSLVDSNEQLAVAARRYPNGLETMNEEAAAEAERRKADGATCGGGYVMAGDPSDFDRQRRLMDATRGGDFAPSIEDALEKYREDTSPVNPNCGPKEYWPSTGAFRSVFYQAGKRLGTEAATLLEKIPDDDLRLFASIEFAAALAGVPETSITYMKRGSPRSRRSGGGRIRSSDRPGMRSPDGRLIRCPKCRFEPPVGLRWACSCGHRWNTFSTGGRCPACRFQWDVTGCPDCGEMSEHRAWYVSEP